MAAIEQITTLISVITREGRVPANLWPEHADLTPADLGLERRGDYLAWPESLAPLDEQGLMQAFPDLAPVIFPLIDSTNSRLLQLGPSTSIADRLYLAEFQYGGRGRRGRTWLSPYGRNLAMSLGAVSSHKLADLGGLSIVVGLALADALENMGVQDVQLKWPNDVLVDNGKLCGILLELVQRKNTVEFVAGIGVNVDLTDEEIRRIGQPVSDLRRCGITASRTDLVIRLIRKVRLYLAHFEDDGFQPFVAAFDALHKFHGQTCSVIQGDNVVRGRVLGIGDQGELILHTSDGEKRFHGGEVSLRDDVM